MLISLLRILPTAGITKGAVCLSRNRGTGRRRLPFFSSGGPDLPKPSLIYLRHAPVKMDTGKIPRSPGLAGSTGIQPEFGQAAVFFFGRINLRLIFNLSSLLILLFFRNRHKKRSRMAIAEGLVIMISVLYRFRCFSGSIRHHGRHKPEIIPHSRTVFMIALIRCTTGINTCCPIPVCANFVFVIKPFK